jgi:cell wall-associated NlpC family hydrolase
LNVNPPGFYGPKTWTGTVSVDPALEGAVGNLSDVLANGNTPPGFLIPTYMEAGRRYGVPWEVLAAINAVETDYGRNLNTSSAGAIGWMQFEPSTWHEWGLAADGHSVPNPYDPRDAIFSAARYLAAAGADKDVWGAVYAYNHASWYVDMVMSRARAIAANVRPERQSVRRGVVSVYFASYQRKHPTVRFRGGHLSHYVRLVASANMVSAANFPYVWGGGHEQPARFAPFDCSGSVSYVMQQAGYKVPTSTSGNIGSWGLPRGPGRVTIFYNSVHTFMRIGNRYFGTSGFARPGGGAGWFSTSRLPANYLAGFSEVHVPALGANSFSRHRRLRLRTDKRHRHTITPLSSTRALTLPQLSPSPRPLALPRLSPSPAFSSPRLKPHF